MNKHLKSLLGTIMGASAMAVRITALLWLWAWFVAPLGLPVLGIWQAWGLMVLQVFIFQPIKKREPDPDAWWERPVMIALSSLFALGIGYGIVLLGRLYG